MNAERQPYDDAFLKDCARIYRDWHERAKARDTAGLLALYAQDAVFESPLVQPVFDGRASGVLRGHAEIGPFFAAGARWPNTLIRWHRTGPWLTDGERLLVWEYPRAAPDGDQGDLVEVMEIEGGLIRHHRVYWGWLGAALLTRNAAEKAKEAALHPPPR